MKKIRKLLNKGILLFTFLYCSQLAAQKYPLTNYTIRDGLSQMQCMQVFQDSRGFVWISTKFGLNRFDGEKFRTFKVKDGLFSDKGLGGIVETPDGNLYIQNREGLLRYDGKLFKKIPFPEGYYSGIGKELFINNKNELIIQLSNSLDYISNIKLFKYSSSEGFKSIDLPKINETLDFKPQHYDLKTDRWYGFGHNSLEKTSKDCYYFQAGKYVKLFETFKNNQVRFQELADNKLISYFNNSKGTQEIHLETNNGTFKKWLEVSQEGKERFFFFPKEDILFDINNDLKFYEAKIKILSKLSDTYYHTTQIIKDKNKFSYWVATESGLLYIPNNGFRYFSEAEAPAVWSVVEDKNKDFLFLPFGSQLKKYKDGKILPVNDHHKLFPFVHPNGGMINLGSADQFYYQPFTDKHGLTWLPNGASLMQYDGKDFKRINKHSAFFLLNDEEEHLIIQCSGDGAFIIENKIDYPTTKLKEGEDLISYPNYMYAYKDNKKRYWVGGWGGLNRFENVKDLKAKKSKEYSQKKGNIPFKGFATLCTDTKGTIWAGTTDGLYYFNEAKDTFIKVGPEKFEGTIGSLIMADSNHLLIATIEGWYALDLKKYYENNTVVAKLYNHHNGYLGLEAGQNGAMKDSKGNIWLTSSSVLSYIEPGKLDLGINPLRPYIEQINKQNVSWDSTAIFEVEERKNDLFLKVGATGFNKSFSTQYSYFVEGVSEKWSDWQISDEIPLVNLPNGTYYVKVKAKTEGLIGEEPNIAKVRVHINAYLWQTPNFYKYASIVFLVLSSLIFFYYYRAFKSNKKLKENQRQLSFLQIQTLQSQLNPHFLFNVLSSLRNLILKKDNVLAEQSLMTLAKLMRNYMESSVISTSKNEAGIQNTITLKQKVEILNDYLYLEQIQHSFKFEYKVNIDDAIDLDAINIPPLIIQPHVENAIKHGIVNKIGKGNVIINFTLEHTILVCTVEDDGIGRIAAAKIKSESKHSYKSYGTHLVKDRVRLLNTIGHNIEISTEDRHPEGTKVTIKFNTQNEA